ncbi:MAG TPA: cytochrome c oxidase subunit II [Pyrinomonadaceae bacterium]|jgi:cytochrome c oxidase subunit 2|nr:cytochrome c oxidase subunit II [Pyrinomonadaceae bacterium]
MQLLQVTVPFAPEQASSFAPEVDALYLYLVAITIFFSTVITALIVYFAIKYRRRSDGEVPRPNAGSLTLETLWSVIPLLIAMTIFAWGTSVYFKLYRTPKEAMDIFVVGKQWMWKFQHAEGQREINELHVPVGARVRLTMTTEDVIHSFYVPAFRIKSDVVPGRYTSAWFEATKTGRFYLFCAEYCGTNHSGMGGYIEVMEPTEYQLWLAGGATDSAASQGQKVFQERGCASCHQADRQGRGPVLQGIFGKPQPLQTGEAVTVDEAYIRESILNPQAKIVAGFQPIMPTYQGQLSEEQILQLIAYIRGLTTGTEGSTGGAGGRGEGATTTSGTSPDVQRSNPLAPTQPSGRGGGASPVNTSPGTTRSQPEGSTGPRGATTRPQGGQSNQR